MASSILVTSTALSFTHTAKITFIQLYRTVKKFMRFLLEIIRNHLS